MRDLTSTIIFFAAVIGTALSKPLWSTLIGDNYLYPTSGLDTQPHYLATYQDAPSPYYIYNLHANVAGLPGTILASGKPEAPHLPTYNFYYETPIYDLRFPIYPLLTPSHPGLPPRPILPPTSTQQPFDEDAYNNVEKLDSKVDPSTGETKKPGSEEDDDSITVEAI